MGRDIYTDGAAINNGRRGARAGVGVFCGDGDPRNISRPLGGNEPQTNNRAELSGIKDAVHIANRDHPNEEVIIFADSEYAINCLKPDGWQRQWNKNGWKTYDGYEVKNRDLIQNITRDINVHGGIRICYVRAHGSSYGNNQADWLAKQGAR
eukprot:GHVR01092033.1.p1 GENE.GHVR01092033.1~~GHVR01092033.1.p1  ORF type:complete len:152 (+),score=29.15 GHVR01092033.1:64-519(+)